MTRVLAVVAHPDDEVIGPGATLARHARSGDEVHVLILADGKTSRPDADPTATAAASHAETAASCTRLGVAGFRRLDLADNRLDGYPLLELAQQVEEIVVEIDPRIVYTHHTGDLNVDHELAARATMIACRPHTSGVRWILGFPTLSATDAGFAARPAFVPALYSPVDETLQAKIEAMECYASEVRDFPHPRSLRAIRAQAELFGAHAGVAAAEAFSVLRGTWSHPIPDAESDDE